MRSENKGTDYARSKNLPKDGVLSVASTSKAASTKDASLRALLLLADICDSIARKDVTHVTLGTPKSGEAFLITVNYPDGSRTFTGGVDVLDLLSNAYSELSVGETVRQAVEGNSVDLPGDIKGL